MGFDRSLERVALAFGALHVLVVGDAMLDSYVDGRVRRLSREAPVPVLETENSEDSPGGAANAAANCASLGAQTDFLGVVGQDAAGEQLRRLLEAANVRTQHLLALPGVATERKVRFHAGPHFLLRVDEGGDGLGDDAAAGQLAERLAEIGQNYDAIFLCDYGRVCRDVLVDALGHLRGGARPLLFVDSHDLARFHHLAPDAVKPNYEEVQHLVGLSGPEGPGRRDWICQQADTILGRSGAGVAAVTLDVDGAAVVDRSGGRSVVDARPQPNSHAIGAGDTYMAAFGLALAAGGTPEIAAMVASAAASAVVSTPGTVTCSQPALWASIGRLRKLVDDYAALRSILEGIRRDGGRAIFTAGCFDLLQSADVAFLQKARSLGDALVVGLHPDAAVARLLGEGRPLSSLADRIAVLAGLSCVDFVTVLDDQGPLELVRLLHPALFVDGDGLTPGLSEERETLDGMGVELLKLSRAPVSFSQAVEGG